VRGILDAAPDATIVNDAGSHTTWVTLHRRVLRERSLIFSGGFGPMGYGLPAAIGAKLADPSRDVIMIAGDGGFQMTIQELGTVAELELPITMCILNNKKLDVIRQWQEMNYGTSYSVELKNPDFIRLADAYGIGAERILRVEDVSGAVERALESGEPRLLEFMVEGEDIPLPGVRP
jgi:Thiamine pyrophosphate-requiring enzymes [acetolactate synthase, pyruvate dehydrogenase (cytochrome), glyoxylate carboligase, phosphonopyruvate decarboxylase]